MQTFESMEDALLVAKAILAGTLEPNRGCGLIAEISRKLGFPSSLQEFSQLAHEQKGHEALGISAKACVPEVMASCRQLLAIKQP